MPATIYQAHGTSINREDALASEKNVIARNSQFYSLVHLSERLWRDRPAVAALVAMHVGARPECVEMGDPKIWKRGGFNLVVPMIVRDKEPRAEDKSEGRDTGTDKASGQAAPPVLLRIPLPAKVGEVQHPGSVMDKLRCEMASYIWMQRHCPEAVAAWLRKPVPSAYLPVALPPGPVPQPLEETGYMILENLSGAQFGRQLPYVVPRDRPLHKLCDDEPVKTRNLCRDLSRIMLSLARVPQPRIGAFWVCLADGTIRLNGRPATCDMAISESEGAARTIALDTTYASADRYVADLARFHELGFRARPNAALDKEDAQLQMAIMVALRAVAHHFVDAGAADNCGPFLPYLSDGNAGNILVDGDWHVTAIFDLEWLFAAPVAQLQPPLWLTWDSIDHVALQEDTPLSDAMEANWTSERTWFYLALSSVDGMTHIYNRRLKRLFWPAAVETGADTDGGSDEKADTDKPHQEAAPALPDEALYQLWQPDARAIIAQKLIDREQHVAAIERLFEDKA
ncbi:hypothetical protein SCUCBS95973_004035 [Sporothrix curviconia]|uniref:Aminoglycoside phosphotransferase domain-containing protein n=1 Tax=Sporothrix curviconia TaxID=1260050 RepID=A0ABP0BLJ5_9PEZI